ncbi:MAG: ATP-binding protein [Halobacteriales archaeon]
MNQPDQPIRVLYVDADSARLAGVKRNLEQSDGRIAVITARDADAALSTLVEMTIDCVVAEYELSDRNGIELLELLRERYDELPFVLFTGRGSEEIASRAISAGVSDYLKRPDEGEQFSILRNRVVTLVEKQRAETALEQIENRYRQLVESAPVPILIYSEAGVLMDVNPAALCLLQAEDASEVMGKSPIEFVHEDDKDAIEERIRRAIEEHQSVPQHEHRIVTLQGEIKHVIAASAPVQYDGEPAIQTIAYDITDRKERERKLEQLHQRTQSLMDTPTKTETAQVAVDTAHEVLDAPLSGFHLRSTDGNRLEPIATVETVESELGRQPVYDRRAESDPISQAVWETFERGESVYIEDINDHDRLAGTTPAQSAIIHPLADHGVFIVSATEPAAFDQTDQALIKLLATSLTVALDRAERETLLRERESELERQNERLDEFTSVVSHDLRNPLSVAEGQLELAMETGDLDHLTSAANAIDRMRTLIDDLLTLARYGETRMTSDAVDLEVACYECWQTIETDSATLELDTTQSIEADEGRLKQLLENLMRNAVDHSSGDVTVTIGDLTDGFYVADTGPGIPADERDTVFKTGYTTAQDGTGFGLSIVDQIVAAHGWEIQLVSSEDGGARFEIRDVERVIG